MMAPNEPKALDTYCSFQKVDAIDYGSWNEAFPCVRATAYGFASMEMGLIESDFHS
jgi:hypothetical protein